MPYRIKQLKQQPHYKFSLKLYLQQNYSTTRGIKVYYSISRLSMLGDLAMCGVPDYFCWPQFFIENNRANLKAHNLFEANIDSTNLTEAKKQIHRVKIEGPHALFDKQNAKLCGWILCYFLLACLKGKAKQFPKLDFLTGYTQSLTPEQKYDITKSIK